jgi:hypothetical protein
MINNLLKKYFNWLINKFNDWRAEPTPLDSSFDSGGRAYPYLNFILMQLIKRNKGSLRPHYTWGVLHGAYLGKVLGIPRITVIEFGVAGGNGLLALEEAAIQIEAILGLSIDVFGFDSGSGLPKPTDYRDLPNLFAQGAYPIDLDKLKACLTKAEVIIGLVEETVPEFMAKGPAPVGFIAFDLDFYSATKAALQLLEADYACLMPRIPCYFDDITGFSHSDFTGERLAIAEFNQSHTMRKISPIYCLRHYVPKKYRETLWPEKFFMAHFFHHPLYVSPDGSFLQDVHRIHTDFKENVP